MDKPQNGRYHRCPAEVVPFLLLNILLEIYKQYRCLTYLLRRGYGARRKRQKILDGHCLTYPAERILSANFIMLNTWLVVARANCALAHRAGSRPPCPLLGVNSTETGIGKSSSLRLDGKLSDRM